MRTPGWYWVKVDDQATWQPVEFVVDGNTAEAKYGGQPRRRFWAIPCEGGGLGESGWWYPTNDDDLYRIHPVRIEEPIKED